MFPTKPAEIPRLIAGNILVSFMDREGKYRRAMIDEAIEITEDLLKKVDEKWPPRS